MQFTSFWSPALLILAGKTGELTKQHLLGRTTIANMKQELAINIHRWALDALKREQKREHSVVARENVLGSHLGELIEPLVEVLSRLTIRLGAEELEEAMSIA